MRGESARPGKRPLRALSASEKMEAIQRVHEGESKASVARDIGVPESTLRGWCKSEQKIRGMARNSSTPDSEAHSPASSSGTNLTMAHANHSSEEEGPCVKRAKVDTTAGSSYISENSENDARMSETSRIDYVTSLMTSMAGMRPENSALLLQQLGLLSGGGSPLAKGLLSMPMVPHSSAVGLVENGLQYTKSNGGKRHSTSAVAPAQMEAVKSSRKSLPPAAEAPQTPVPASPRKTSDSGTREKREIQPNHHNKKADEALWMWLTQQQQLLGQQSAAFNLSNNHHDGSWFWQWYKQFNYPGAPLATPVAKKSPSKTRALLDNVLCNNNNENVKHFIEGEESGEREAGISSEEAIEHGEKFVQWLEKCSEPAVTRVQIIQFKYLIDNLKACRKKSTTAKQSRK
ncbi:protein distal antenna [Diachasma alloeum]|uniref:protein distal antenna n=1 Tax=Diachasma alloeum TaxID=454923 RepID=UPI0007384BF6|nr:protein distal antenna [Diachasma alloeum]